MDITPRRLFACTSLAILTCLLGCGSDDATSPQAPLTVTDIDGNVYPTVEIAGIIWMAKNLSVTRYRNGVAIPFDLDTAAWVGTTSGASAVYPHAEVDGVDSAAEMADAYGRLYNWYAVADTCGLCPEGWRVPTEAQWTQLELHLGMTPAEAAQWGWRGTDEAARLKSTRTEPDAHPRWSSPNEGATNQSGFSGLPGGFRRESGSFDRHGSYAYWWSSTQYQSAARSAMRRALFSPSTRVDRNFADKAQGMSIRCVKD